MMESLSSKVTSPAGRRVPYSHYQTQIAEMPDTRIQMLEGGKSAAILQAPTAKTAIGNPTLTNLKAAAIALIRARSRIFSIQSSPSFSLGYG